ncbi:hypothetical protein ANO14919_052510 [Xylariales sp. No.14919]|nr:hypothetical protein ANO14919_052510 [Xylariales sp. No.14919]
MILLSARITPIQKLETTTSMLSLSEGDHRVGRAHSSQSFALEEI